MAQYFAVAFYVLQRSFRPEMVGREAVGVGVGVIGTPDYSKKTLSDPQIGRYDR